MGILDFSHWSISKLKIFNIVFCSFADRLANIVSEVFASKIKGLEN
jgi:hypothetical protein